MSISTLNQQALFFIVLFVACLSTSHGTALAQSELSMGNIPEISVSATADAALTADRYTVLIALEQTGASAEEALKGLELLSSKIKASVTTLDAESKIQAKGDSFRSAADLTAPITSGTVIRVRREIEIETKNTQTAALIVDAVIKNGAHSVLEVRQFSSSPAAAKKAAIERASREAKEKAQQMANILGLELKGLISGSLTEEPTGASIRRSMQTGASLDSIGDTNIAVHIGLRYQVGSK